MRRLNYDRSTARRSDLDALAGLVSPPATPRMVVKVYDGGDLPTQADRVYLCRPVALSAPSAPAEGGDYSTAVDDSQSIPVVFVERVPSVGDMAIAHRIGGVWVATSPRPSRGFCPLCSMETKGLLTLTFTFSSGKIATKSGIPMGFVGSGDAVVYNWSFFPNPLDGSDTFYSYPNFAGNVIASLSCTKDRTYFAFTGARDVIPALGRPNPIEPLPDLDESNVISCGPLHIVWTGSAPLRYPVPEIGNLVGFEAEEVP